MVCAAIGRFYRWKGLCLGGNNDGSNIGIERGNFYVVV